MIKKDANQQFWIKPFGLHISNKRNVKVDRWHDNNKRRQLTQSNNNASHYTLGQTRQKCCPFPVVWIALQTSNTIVINIYACNISD